MRKREFILVATLNNGKKAVLEPDFEIGKCSYRYLSQYEVDNDTLEVDKNYIWQETPLLSTTEDDVLVVYAVIDFTPVILNRI